MPKKIAVSVWIAVLAALAAAAPASAGFPFFGGKKDEAKPQEPPPGFEAGAPDMSKPPKMAQEAEKSKAEASASPTAQPSLPGVGQPPASQETPAAASQAPQDGQEAPGAAASEKETAVGEFPADGSQEVVIKGKGGAKVTKPPLNIEVDPFESIRDSLQPDQNLLLAESPLTVVWRRTHPEFVRNARVIDPSLTTFSERPGVVFSPLRELNKVLERRLQPKEAKGYSWTLTIVDEEGKVFQLYEGKSYPPEELVWSGQNDQGEWMRAGAAYSPVYQFTDPNANSYTRAGNPIRFNGIMHQERDGLHITLDSAALFGKSKASEKLHAEGQSLVRSAADVVKRGYNSGVLIRVEAYSGSKELAERQAQDVEQSLKDELMLLPQEVSTDSLQAPYADQRLEIVLLNR